MSHHPFCPIEAWQKKHATCTGGGAKGGRHFFVSFSFFLLFFLFFSFSFFLFFSFLFFSVLFSLEIGLGLLD